MTSLVSRIVGAALLIGTAATLSPAMAKDLVIARAGSPATLDPGFLREPGTLVDNVFDTLILRDAQMKLVPGLALSWSAVDDTTWEFKLRPGVKFHNGEAFDAAAVKFTFERVLDPEAKSPTISYVRTVTGVDVVDPLSGLKAIPIAQPASSGEASAAGAAASGSWASAPAPPEPSPETSRCSSATMASPMIASVESGSSIRVRI